MADHHPDHGPADLAADPPALPGGQFAPITVRHFRGEAEFLRHLVLETVKDVLGQ